MAHVSLTITNTRNLHGTTSRWIIILGGKFGQTVSEIQAKILIKEFDLTAGTPVSETKTVGTRKQTIYKIKYS